MLTKLLNLIPKKPPQNQITITQSNDGRISVEHSIGCPDNFMEFFDYLVECKFIEQVINGLPRDDKVKFQQATLEMMATLDAASQCGNEDDYTEEDLVEELNRPAMLPSQVFSNHDNEGEQKSTK